MLSAQPDICILSFKSHTGLEAGLGELCVPDEESEP